MVTVVTWPLERNVIRKHSVHNTFGMVRKKADGTPKPHQGWDLEASVGTSVHAIADGKVVFVHNGGDYGLQVCLSFRFQEKTHYAFYAHLGQLFVAAGQEVKLGELIGTSGKSGNASNLPADEEHLHFEIRTTPYCGHGLDGRISPLAIYGICPLHAPIMGRVSGVSGPSA
jgi:murein DD-endopeptidase MepM/ murein hydrolase activator NlpD